MSQKRKRKSRAKPLPDTGHIEDHELVWDPDWWLAKALRNRGFFCERKYYYHPEHWSLSCHRLFAKSRRAAESVTESNDE